MPNTQPPPEEPHDVGDRVRVRLADADAESPFDGAICRVVHVFVDGPERDEVADGGSDPEREMDRASYRLENIESGEVLPVVVRHRDVVPADDEP
jgi:hypothetical protein